MGKLKEGTGKLEVERETVEQKREHLSRKKIVWRGSETGESTTTR